MLKYLYEKLAAIEHERWSDWQKYMFSKCTKNNDGSLTIPPELVERWTRQMNTEYESLPEDEKQSDRDQVNRYWHLFLSALDLPVPMSSDADKEQANVPGIC